MTKHLQVPLGELVKIVGGGTPDKKKSEYWNGSIPWASVKDFKSSSIKNTKDFITPEGVANSATNIIPSGNILVPTRMAVGKVAINEIDLAINQDLKALIPNERVEKHYLIHALQANSKKLEDQATGATVKGIKLSALKELEIPLPPLEEQKRIAAILDQADALRRLRQSTIDRLNTLGQSIFYEMFGANIFGSSKSQHVELRRLASSLQNGAYFPKDRYVTNGTEMVHMSDAFSGMVTRGNLKRVNATQTEIKKYNLTERDILIARRSLTLEGAAKPCLVPPHKDPLLFESSFIRVTPIETVINHIYLYYYLADPKIKEIALRPFITQSTISGINQSNLGKVPVYVPSIKEQLEFEERIKILSENEIKNRSSLVSFQTLFSSLQQRAFRGEL